LAVSPSHARRGGMKNSAIAEREPIRAFREKQRASGCQFVGSMAASGRDGSSVPALEFTRHFT
jgi:hypothetical protein